MRRLLTNDSGASAAEYALIVAVFGTAIAIASVAMGPVLRDANPATPNGFLGPGGTRYRCIAQCQYEDYYYCSAHRVKAGDPTAPVFSPALPPLPKDASGNEYCPM